MAAELRQAGGRAAARPAVAQAPRRREYAGRGVDGGPPPEVAEARAAAVAAATRTPACRPSGGRGPARRRPAAARSSIPVIELGPGADEGGRVRGPGALEGPPPGGGRAPRARGRHRDGDARPRLRLVPAAAQPDARPRRRCARRRSRSTRTPPPTTGRACPTTSGQHGWPAEGRPVASALHRRPTSRRAEPDSLLQGRTTPFRAAVRRCRRPRRARQPDRAGRLDGSRSPGRGARRPRARRWRPTLRTSRLETRTMPG